MLKGRDIKGLSTVVATLLIVLLVLVSIAVIWLVVKNVIQGGSEQVSLGKLTLNLEIKNIARDVGQNSMDVKIKRNVGDGDFSGLQFIVDNGKSTEIVIVSNSSLEELEEETYNLILNSSMNVSNLESVSVAPIFTLESGDEVVGSIEDTYIFGDSSSTAASCSNTCSSLGYTCGTQSVCGESVNCGTCETWYTCNSTGQCVAPVCGDTICNGAETCNSCSADCGTCISTCTTLSASGKYMLTSNVTSTGTCFTISAENVTLDCNNNWIIYSTAGAADTYGIYTNRANIVIKNCNILDGAWDSTQTTRHGIVFNSANNSIISNNFINANKGKAIYLYNAASFNSLISNVAKSNSETGISLRTFSNNNTLTANNITSNASTALEVVQSSNDIITNNVITTNAAGTAFYLYLSSKSIVTGNTGTSKTSTGLYFSGISDSTIENNIGTGGSRGITFSGTYNVLTNNTGVGNSTGFEFSSGSNNTFINNTGINLGDGTGFNTGEGISIYSGAKNNTFIGNTGTSKTRNGIFLNGVSNNILINNFGRSNTYLMGGIYLESSPNNLFINNTGINPSGDGVYIRISLNNTFISQIATGRTGVFFRDSNNTIFRDCTNIQGDLYNSGVYYYGNGMSINNTFINCSYNGETMGPAGTELIRKWYYQTIVEDGNNNLLSNANVVATNNLGVVQFTALTDSSGVIQRQEVIDYVNNAGTKTYYSNYTITASKTGYSTGTKTYDFTTQNNKVDDLFILSI
jgi:parallel beta-helix repeat protein